MALNMMGEIHYIDEPELEFVGLTTEPRSHTSASIDSGVTFMDEATEQSAKEVRYARMQAKLNEENRIRAAQMKDL